LLKSENRAHVELDLIVDHLGIVAAELVRNTTGWSKVNGYLLVHVEAAEGAPESAQSRSMAAWPDRDTRRARSVFGRIEQSVGGSPVAHDIAASPRAVFVTVRNARGN